jgi:hypothetical protein
MSEPAYEFGIVCEGPADEFTACTLADRVLLERVDWLEPELLDSEVRERLVPVVLGRTPQN